jgi:hypothetical protein
VGFSAVRSASSDVRLLDEGIGSLARGIPPVEPGTLFVLGTHGGMSVSPNARFTLVFGRNEPDVHVCIGADDPRVSRRQGQISFQGSRWVLENMGKVPIRMPGSRLVLSGHAEVLPMAYTPLFIVCEEREHLLEVRVADRHLATEPVTSLLEATTRRAQVWRLTDRERLVLVSLGRRYLRHEVSPQPLTWAEVVCELSELRPAERWGVRGVANVVANVRDRLRVKGVTGLSREEVGEPVGNALNHNLLMELLVSTTLVPTDLRLLGD